MLPWKYNSNGISFSVQLSDNDTFNPSPLKTHTFLLCGYIGVVVAVCNYFACWYLLLIHPGIIVFKLTVLTLTQAHIKTIWTPKCHVTNILGRTTLSSGGLC